jgi:hypothetical protein
MSKKEIRGDCLLRWEWLTVGYYPVTILITPYNNRTSFCIKSLGIKIIPTIEPQIKTASYFLYQQIYQG